MNDIAEKITTALDGKTGRANSPVNANEDFQDGFRQGKIVVETGAETFDAITSEWQRRGCPETISPSFKEWKRGLWAAVMQGTIAKAMSESTES